MSVTPEDLALVERVASRLSRRSDWQRDELVSDGAAALPKAAADWESNRVLRSHFAGQRDNFITGRVRRSMIDGLRQRNGRAKHGFRRQTFETGMERLDRPSADDSNESELDRFVGADDAALGDVDVEDLLAQLPSREREVIRRTVINGELQEDVANDLGVTASRVSQIRARALERLRQPPGQPPPPPLPASRGGLSGREVQVLELMAEGLVNDDIAAELEISQETVKSHVRHILAKMHARSRTHAVAQGFRRRLLS